MVKNIDHQLLLFTQSSSILDFVDLMSYELAMSILYLKNNDDYWRFDISLKWNDLSV